MKRTNWPIRMDLYRCLFSAALSISCGWPKRSSSSLSNLLPIFKRLLNFLVHTQLFFSFLPGWCLLANKKIFETKITAERTGCNKLTQTSSSVTLTRNYLSDVSRVLILTFVLSLERSTTTNSQCQENLSSGKNFPIPRMAQKSFDAIWCFNFFASLFHT